MTVHSRLIGSGSVLPGEPISNDELAARLARQGVETSDEWIVARTGIRQRYFADGQTTSELAAEAARQALDNAGIAADQIDLIIVAPVLPVWCKKQSATSARLRLTCKRSAPALFMGWPMPTH